MKKKVLAAILLAVGVLTGCGNSEPISSPIQTVEAEPIATDTKEVEQPAATESSADEVAPEHSYRSELTNEWIDEDLKDQRPIAVMVDNERTALPHFGTADADVVYEIMNSTLNDRITRFMVVVKDWEKIEQLGSIRSARPTNFMLAAEWNAVLCHDGGPYFINDWVAKDYSANFSGGFARFNNGKATEFTEYITYDTYTNSQKGKTYDGLKQRFANSKYTTTYNDYYQGPHFKFADGEVTFDDRSDAISATTIALPFKHNGSTLKYNEETGTYDYYEYGSAHKDADSNAQLTFENVILQDTTFAELGEGYLIYNAIDSGRSGYYITQGKAIEVTWTKSSENAITHYYDAKTGEEIELPLEKLSTKKGTGAVYQLRFPKIGRYELVFRMSSTLGPLAQLPISVFLNNTLQQTVTINGTEGKVVEQSVTLAIRQDGEKYMKLYFGESGIDMHRMFLRYVGKNDIESFRNE